MWWIALLLGVGNAPAGSLAEAPRAEPGKGQWVYVGTYTDGKSRGIYRLALDNATGKLSSPEVAAETPDPSFLAIHPSRKLLYAANEVSNYGGKPAGSVSGFALDAETGGLSPLNRESTGGPGPCFVAVDRTGKALLVANYGGGSVASYPLDEDGKIGPAASFIQHKGTGGDKSRQSEPHAHSINVDAGNRYVVAADLGLDKLLVYRLDPAKATLVPNDPPSASIAPGSGPRHFAFHPDGRHAYAINELKSTVTALAYDPSKGVLTPEQTISTLPEGYKGRSYTAEVQVHPSGKFLYGSNRGHDSIAVFAIEPGAGRLTSVEQVPAGGRTPRNFGIDATGKYLLAANQNSGTIVAFRIDPETGRLTPTGQAVEVPSPVCVKFVPRP